MPFFKYPSLTNEYAVAKSRSILSKMNTIAYSTEKIHGSNVQYVFDDRDDVVNFGAFSHNGKKIGGKDDKGEHIMDTQFKLVMDIAFQMDLPNIASSIFTEFEEVDSINIYGEYFGSGVQKTQYFINEREERGFQVFDIFLHYKEDPQEVYRSMGLLELIDYVGRDKMVPIEDIDFLSNLIEKDIVEQSHYGGEREGNVYKEIHGSWIDPVTKYCGIKHKRAEFLEVSKAPKQPKVKLSDEFLEVVERLSTYVTENRVRNVHSHGDIKFINKNIGAIMLEVKKDILKEFADNEDYAPDVDLSKAIKSCDRDIAMAVRKVIAEVGDMED